MAHGFKAANHHVEIVGVGVATRDRPVPLERAAQVLHELQDEHGKPLTGDKLVEAAKDFGARRSLRVVQIPKAVAEAEMEPAITAAEQVSAVTPDEEVKK